MLLPAEKIAIAHCKPNESIEADDVRFGMVRHIILDMSNQSI